MVSLRRSTRKSSSASATPKSAPAKRASTRRPLASRDPNAPILPAVSTLDQKARASHDEDYGDPRPTKRARQDVVPDCEDKPEQGDENDNDSDEDDEIQPFVKRTIHNIIKQDVDPEEGIDFSDDDEDNDSDDGYVDNISGAESDIEDDEDIEDQPEIDDGDVDETVLNSKQRAKDYLLKHNRATVNWLSESEKDNRLAIYRQRLLDAVSHLHVEAKKLDYKSLSAKIHDKPMTQQWCSFLTKLSPEAAVKLLLQHTPERTQIILGGDLRPSELYRLPHDWQKTTLHGVYCDFTTENGQNFMPYSGSATGRHGFSGRLGYYEQITRLGLQPKVQKPSLHEIRINRRSVQSRLRIVAVFDQQDYINVGAYIYLYEFLTSSLLQCFNNTKVNTRGTEAGRKLARNAFGSVPAMAHTGLNAAVQILQACSPRGRKKNKVCANPACGATDSPSWFTADPGLPLSGVLCHTCGRYRARYGTMRPVRLVKRAEARKKPLPADKKCTSCNLLVSGRWCLHPKTSAWICQACWHRLRCKIYRGADPADLPDAVIYNKPKPLDECCTLCHVHIPDTVTKLWRKHPTTSAWVCFNCYQNARKAVKAGRTPVTTVVEQAPKPSDGRCSTCRVLISDTKRGYWSQHPMTSEWLCENCRRKVRYAIKTGKQPPTAPPKKSLIVTLKYGPGVQKAPEKKSLIVTLKYGPGVRQPTTDQPSL